MNQESETSKSYLNEKLQALRASAGRKSDGFIPSQDYCCAFRAVRKKDGEILEAAVDNHQGKRVGVLSHVTPGGSDEPRRRWMMFGRDQLDGLTDLLIKGVEFSKKPRDQNDLERLVAIDELPAGEGRACIRLMATPNGAYWNVKLQGEEDSWLPFSHLDGESLAEALACIEQKFQDLEEDF